MGVIYASTTEALARAFATPRPKVARPSFYTSGVGRSHGELSAEERMAQDGMVQALALERCHPKSVQVFRILWEGDHAMAIEAVDTVIRDWRKPSKRPPVEFCAATVQQWAGRRLMRLPELTVRSWARALDMKHGKLNKAKNDLRGHLQSCKLAGVLAMELALEEAGLLAWREDCEDEPVTKMVTTCG